MDYKQFVEGNKAADQCVACGQCESVCPQNLAIIERAAGGGARNKAQLEELGFVLAGYGGLSPGPPVPLRGQWLAIYAVVEGRSHTYYN